MVDVKGVNFPVYMDQVDFPYFKRFTEKKLFPVKKEKKFIDDVRKEKQSEINRVEDGVWLTFLPVMDTDEFGDIVVDEMKLHLVNHTRESYNFHYQLQYFVFQLKFQQLSLHLYLIFLNLMNHQKQFHIEHNGR